MRMTDCPQRSRTRHTLAVVAHPSVVWDARSFVAQRLAAWGIDGQTAECAVLVASELVTNAVRHAGGFAIRLSVCWNFGDPRIEVWDPLADVWPVRRDAAEVDESGRGLVLVETLADRWGVEREPTGGKTVYAVVCHDLP